jgi:lipoyl(octanoyl) transferase
MADTWRYIHTPAARGAWNMAVDEAVLETAGRAESLPTLRLYAWQPACLSLGYAQSFRDVDLDRLKSNGWDLVRRVTGGRAILHIDELTYSIAAPPDEPRLLGTVLESYQRMANALILAVRALGLPVEMEANAPPADATRGPVCFEVPSAYEIVVDGKKLIGSAQTRKRTGILQHGSFPLHGDLTRITQALVFPNEQARLASGHKLLGRAVTAETVTGRIIPWEAAAQAFVSAFETSLGIKLEPGELTLAEKTRADELVRNKYDHPEWTERS